MESGERSDASHPNAYRSQSSQRFEQACRLSGMSNTALALRLKRELGRSTLTRQTLAGWRTGEQAVPFEAFLAVLELAGPEALSFIVRSFEDEVARHLARGSRLGG